MQQTSSSVLTSISKIQFELLVEEVTSLLTISVNQEQYSFSSIYVMFHLLAAAGQQNFQFCHSKIVIYLSFTKMTTIRNRVQPSIATPPTFRVCAHEKFQRNAFIFYIYENPKLLFLFLISCYYVFLQNECPGLCRHRQGHSLGKNIKLHEMENEKNYMCLLQA